MQKIKENKFKILFILLFIIVVICLVYSMSLKVGFHMDELFSYSLANNNQQQTISTMTDQWLTPDYFYEFLTATSESNFNYSGAYINQVNDVHPPLYYFVMHTISSIFPGIFSKWIGLSINFMVHIAVFFILYFLMKELTSNRYFSVVVSTLYSVSIGSLSNANYIRMYSLQSLVTILLSLITIKVITEEENKFFIAIFVLSLIGVLTQYYFLIFAFFTTLLVLIIFLAKKRFGSFAKYALASGGSVIAGYLIFPASYNHITNSSRGTEAIGNFQSNNLFLHFTDYLNIIREQLLGNIDYIFLFLGVILIVFIVYKNIQVSTKIKAFILIVPVTMYIFFIQLVAPYQINRYIFPIYPVIFALIGLLFYSIYSLFTYKTVLYGATIALALITFIGHYTQDVSYQYENHQESLNISKEYSDTPAYYVTRDDSSWKFMEHSNEFLNYQNSYLGFNSQEFWGNNPGNISRFERFILYKSNNIEDEEVLNNVENNTDFNQFNLLYSDGGTTIFMVEK